MKNTVFFLALLALVNFSIAQSDPTLSVGLSSLTSYSKGTIDVELLTEIILEKQQELKDEALKRFMFRLFPEENYTTKFYLQSALHILLNEKNPEVIRKELMEILTNYSLALGFSLAYKKLHPSDLSDYTGVFVDKAVAKREALLTTYKNYQKVGRLNRLNHQIKQLQLELDSSKSDAVYEYIGFRETLLNEFYDSALKEFEEFVKDTCLQINADDKRKELCGLLTGKFDEFQKQENPDETERMSEIFDLLKINPGEFQSKGITNKSFRKTKRKGIRLARKEKSYRTKKFRKGFQENHFENTENDSIPFHLLLDVVATVLSENDTLQKKGFYKNKVDYQKSYAYVNFAVNQKNKLDTLKKSIKKNINIYINQYQWFKEIVKEAKNLTGDKNEVVALVSGLYNKEFANELEKSDVLENTKLNLDEYKRFSSLNSGLNLAKKKLKQLDENVQKTDLESELKKTYNSNENNISAQDIKKFEPIIELKNFENTLNLNNGNTSIKDSSNTMIEEFTFEKIRAKINLNTSYLSNDNNENLKALKAYAKDLKETKNESKVLTEKITSIQKDIEKELRIINDTLREKYNSDFIAKISDLLSNDSLDLSLEDSITVRKTALFTKKLFVFIEKIKEKNADVSLGDILYLQHEIFPELVEIQVLIKKSKNPFEDLRKNLVFVIPYLKSHAIKKIVDIYPNLSFDQAQKIVSLMSFLSNLDNLNKAETFESILDLFRKGNEEVQKHLKDNDFGRMYTLFANTIKKYTLINSEEQKINVDVASALIELEAYYDKNKIDKWGFYLGIGISQNWIPGSLSFPDATNNSSTIALASEKLGVQLKIMDFRRADDYKNTVPGDVYLSKQSPFINEWYTMAYGSGLLYSVANATSNQAFDYPQIGVGTGIRFYNALDFNLTLSMPFIEDQSPFSNLMIGVGFDIPLSEYLSRSRAKRAKKDE